MTKINLSVISIAIFSLGLFFYIKKPHKIYPQESLANEKTQTTKLPKIDKTPAPEKDTSFATNNLPSSSQKRHKPAQVLQLKATTPPPSHKNIARQKRVMEEGYGKFPAIDLSKMNSQKASIVEAHSDPKHFSNRISIIGKREKFDLDRYQSNPDYYLNITEPGRAFDTAQPATAVKPLARLSSAYEETVQGEAVYLSVQGKSSMPISFTAFDGGQFQNGLSSITLKADSSGTATAEFLPTGGVINDCRIRAASPMSSGTLAFTVNVGFADEKVQ